MAQVRMIVNDVDAAVAFYTDHLGFALDKQFGPTIAMVSRDDLTLWLAGPNASASQPMPDGTRPVPGGWARFVLTVDDLAKEVSRLTAAGVSFRNTVVSGPGGQQILVLDPSGNVVELFQAA